MNHSPWEAGRAVGRRNRWVERIASLATAAAVCGALFLVAREMVSPVSGLESEPVGKGQQMSTDLVLQPLTLLAQSESPVEVRVPGARPTLLLVFSSTCPACYANLPAWRRVIEAAGAGVRVVAVGLEPNRTAAREYARRHLPDAVPTVPRDPRRLAETLGVSVVPFTALIDSGGILRFIKRGSLDSAAVSAFTNAVGAWTRGEELTRKDGY